MSLHAPAWERQPDVVGLILAGGAGRRLGGARKGDLRLGNVSLLARVVAALRPHCASILFSVGANDNASYSDVIPIPDAPDGISGPAAGLLAGARWCDANRPGALMASVSVDTPFLPSDFVPRALDLLDAESGCVVSAYGGRDYPTNALWRPDHLLANLAGIPPAPRGPRLRDVQAALGGRTLDYSDSTSANPFAGINRLADILALERRLKAMANEKEEWLPGPDSNQRPTG